MTAKAIRRPSETQQLRTQVKELEDRIEGYLNYARTLEEREGNSAAHVKALEARLRTADYDLRHTGATIRSLARQLSELEIYRTQRERMDARDADRVMAMADNGASRIGAAA